MTCTNTCIRPTRRNAHCGSCHTTFGAVTAFDKHRRGGHCADPTTMRDLHLGPNGIWRIDGRRPDTDAHSRRRRTP